MRQFISLAILFILFAFTACIGDVNKDLLVNNWQGVKVEHDGQTQNISVVKLKLDADKNYSFTDISSSTMTGKYSTLGNMLYLHKEEGDKIAMEVKELTAKKLIVNTNPGAIPVVMTLKAGK